MGNTTLATFENRYSNFGSFFFEEAVEGNNLVNDSGLTFNGQDFVEWDGNTDNLHLNIFTYLIKGKAEISISIEEHVLPKEYLSLIVRKFEEAGFDTSETHRWKKTTTWSGLEKFNKLFHLDIQLPTKK
jgi:hypothetical protein